MCVRQAVYVAGARRLCYGSAMSDQKPRARVALEVPAVSRSGYPEPFRSRVLPRETRALGDAFGLTHLGVSMATIQPGKHSSVRHYHAEEDELVYVLEGELVLETNAGEEPLRAGMVVGFPAGVADGHRLINRSNAPATYLAMSNRHPNDSAVYPDEDLRCLKQDGRYVFTRKDGSSY